MNLTHKPTYETKNNNYKPGILMKLQFQQKILKLWQAQSPSILNVRQQAAFVGKIIYQLTVSILKFLKNNEKNDTDHIIGFPVNQL